MTRARGAGPAALSLQIEIAWRVRKLPRGDSLLHRAAAHAARAEGFRSGALSIAVIGRQAMRTLHRRHMQIDTPTDVLTFDLDTDRKRGWLEGEIVVCRDVARQVVGSDSPGAVSRELALYVVHGVLHLAGYDDHDPADFRRMHARENQLLSQLSLGKVFGNIIE